MLHAEGLEVWRGGRRVLGLDSLALGAGQTLALLGPNGAGKSTLLRVLALLERPARGTLQLFGTPVPGAERARLALRRRLAVVFQDPLLLDRTVAENVAVGLRLRGVSGAEVTRRVTHWLERFGLGALAERHPRTLSGGEARRVSLARAFVLEPELLLLDEPFASLDVHGRQALALELELILKEARLTTILVTHDRTEALLLADRALVLMEGSKRQEGPVRQVFAAPADAAVARFLGVENLLPAEVGPGPDGQLHVRLGRASFPAPATLRPGPALLLVRAEDIHFRALGTPAEPGWLRLEATARRVVPYGVPYRVELEVGGTPVVALAARHTVERHGLTPGREALLSMELRTVHVVPGAG